MTFIEYGPFLFQSFDGGGDGLPSWFAPSERMGLVLHPAAVFPSGRDAPPSPSPLRSRNAILGARRRLFAAVVLAFSPRFIEFSNEVKPDTWQVCFIMLSLYFLARAFEPRPGRQGTLVCAARLRFGWVLAAWAAAGAAFGTKYQGILLGPLLLAWAAFSVPASRLGSASGSFSRAPCASLLAFAGAGPGNGPVHAGPHAAYPLNVMLFFCSRTELASASVARSFYWQSRPVVLIGSVPVCRLVPGRPVAAFTVPVLSFHRVAAQTLYWRLP